MDDTQEILEIREKLNRANVQYYDLDAPEMTDYEYDHLLRRLIELEEAHPELLTADSPSQRVGGHASATFAPVTHPVPLESLLDVFSFEELSPCISFLSLFLFDVAKIQLFSHTTKLFEAFSLICFIILI